MSFKRRPLALRVGDAARRSAPRRGSAGRTEARTRAPAGWRASPWRCPCARARRARCPRCVEIAGRRLVPSPSAAASAGAAAARASACRAGTGCRADCAAGGGAGGSSLGGAAARLLDQRLAGLVGRVGFEARGRQRDATAPARAAPGCTTQAGSAATAAPCFCALSRGFGGAGCGSVRRRTFAPSRPSASVQRVAAAPR